MKEITREILEKYQVRKTKKQKQEFIIWLNDTLSNMGYGLQRDKYSKNGENLIVGDVVEAKILFTAHYDTQPTFIFPMIMGFSNWGSFLLSQIIMIYPIILISVLYVVLAFLISGGTEVNIVPVIPILLLYSFQIIYGVANKHTANDNTSGVLTLLSILNKIPVDQRDSVCFIFFDEEEKGLVGSAHFKKKYKNMIKNKPLINFDCVGNGDTLSFVLKKDIRNAEFYNVLLESCEENFKNTNKNFRIAKALTNIYSSDQLRFSDGVGVVASNKLPIFGYYLTRIHTKWDTKLDYENIELLTRCMLTVLYKI